MTEYCFLKNNVVQAVLVCDEKNAEDARIKLDFDTYILRPNMLVGLGHTYHNGKIWDTIIDEAGHEVETALS